MLAFSPAGSTPPETADSEHSPATTGTLFLAAFAGIATGSTSAVVVVSFTAAVILAWTWLAITTAHLRQSHPAPPN